MFEKSSQELRALSNVRSRLPLFFTDINDAYFVDTNLLETIIKVLKG